jgi:hypothetical protein
METIKKIGLSFFIPLFLYMLMAYVMPSHTLAEEKGRVFSTWDGFEVDKCASIWLIKRFINENAIIKFFPRGEIIKEGIAFDTPDAIFRRYHNMSTFESLLKHYRLGDPKLIHISKIIHDIEVNSWEKKVLEETLIVQDDVNKIIWNVKNRNEVIQKSGNYFDSLYQGNALKNKRFP